MELSITQDGESVRFKLNGTIDESGAEDLKSRFKELKSSKLKELVMDFRGVDYIGSAGIGKLLLFYKEMAIDEGRIRIENLNETLYDMLKSLKLDTLFSLSKA